MGEQELTALRSLDWEDIAAKVLSAARVYAARYAWNEKSVLPDGSSLEDVVAEAIQEIWAKPSRINPTISLTAQLKGIVRSKLWNLAKSADERVIRNKALEQTESADDDTRHVENRDEFSRAIELLLTHPKIRENEELELVVMAISFGASTQAEISIEMSLPITRIYQLTRELRSIYPTIAQELLREGPAA